MHQGPRDSALRDLPSASPRRPQAAFLHGKCKASEGAPGPSTLPGHWARNCRMRRSSCYGNSGDRVGDYMNPPVSRACGQEVKVLTCLIDGTAPILFGSLQLKKLGIAPGARRCRYPSLKVCGGTTGSLFRARRAPTPWYVSCGGVTVPPPCSPQMSLGLTPPRPGQSVLIHLLFGRPLSFRLALACKFQVPVCIHSVPLLIWRT